MALNFNQFAAEANEFLNEYTKELMLDGDTDKAGRILSSILHGLRHVITIEESLQLISQFPMFLKAVYVNTWSAHKKKRVKNMTEFIDLVMKFDGSSSIIDFKEAIVFAYLGALYHENRPNTLPSVTGAKRETSSGVLHRSI